MKQSKHKFSPTTVIAIIAVCAVCVVIISVLIFKPKKFHFEVDIQSRFDPQKKSEITIKQ